MIDAINAWVESQGLPRGELALELVDETTGEIEAVLDLAWPEGIQVGLTSPVALLLNEDSSVEEAAGSHGFRFFTSEKGLRKYVDSLVRGGEASSEWTATPASRT